MDKDRSYYQNEYINKKRTINIYYCVLCKHEFELPVRKYETKGQWGKTQSVSDQVSCPLCKNFLKTWEISKK